MNLRFCSSGRILPYLFYFSLFYLLLWCWKPAGAQSVPQFKPLQIGDTLPDVTIKNILHYKTPTAKLSDFKGKLLILDFWATWCSPCVYMIPRMDSLQKQFDGKVQFLAVSSEPESKVAAFRSKYDKRHGKRIEGPEVTEDTVLSKLFYHTALPHYVWIDQHGVVVAITEMDQINTEKISSFLLKNNSVLKEKKDETAIAYDNSRPLLANGNGGDGSNLVYHSLLTGYTPGLNGGFSWKIDKKTGRSITVTNCSRLWLYRIAYAGPGGWFDEGSVVMRVKEPSALTSSLSGQAYRNWLDNGHGFCYELIVPAYAQTRTNSIMQQDLKNLFPQYDAQLQISSKHCLVLEKIGNLVLAASLRAEKPEIQLDRFGWFIKNATLMQLVDRINKTQNYPVKLVDQTGLKHPIDLSIEGSLSDLPSLNKALGMYGLRLVEKQLDQQVLVISDHVTVAKN